MSRSMIRAAIVAAAAAVLTIGSAAPASATVHEIVAQWCSGQPELNPPGISGGSNADNFARPLAASKFVGPVVPFQDGFLLQFNWDNRNSKTTGSGIFVVIGEIGGQPLYLELPAPDPDFPAFQRCPKMTSH